MIFPSSGKLIFDPHVISKKHEKQKEWKTTAIIHIDDDLWRYYQWFLKTRFHLFLEMPIRGTHLTIINDIVKDKQQYEQGRSKWNKQVIHFNYSNELRTNGRHWWVKVYSDDIISKIRTECGLITKPYFSPHITIGTAEHRNVEHSNYILEQIKRFEL